MPPQRDTTTPTTTPTPADAPTTIDTSIAPATDTPAVDAPTVEDFAARLARADATAADGEPYAAVQAISDAQALVNHCEGRMVELAQGLYATYRRQLILEDSALPTAVAELLDTLDATSPTADRELDTAVEELAQSDADVAYWLYYLIHKDTTRMVTAEVAAAVGWSPREASWAVRSWLSWDNPAERLLTDAMISGRLEIGKAAIIAEGIDPLTTVEDKQRVCRLVLPRATALPRRRLAELVRSLAAQLDPAAVERRHADQVADRALIIDDGMDNTTIIKALGVPPDQAAAAYHRIDNLARCARDNGDHRSINQLRCDLAVALLTGTAQFEPASTTSTTSDSTGDSTGNDGSAEAADNSSAGRAQAFPVSPHDNGGDGQQRAAGLPDTVLTVPLQTLLTWFGDTEPPPPSASTRSAPSPAPASTAPAPRTPAAQPPVHTDRHGPLLDTVARRVLNARLHTADRGEGEWRLAVTDKQGRVVQYHALHTRTLRGLRREATAVDQRWCVFPTCTKPALRCQADHATAFSQVHETRLDNIDPLCSSDHSTKTVGGYRIVRVPAGDPTDPGRGWQILMRSRHRYRTPNPVPPTITNPTADNYPASKQSTGDEANHDPPPF